MGEALTDFNLADIIEDLKWNKSKREHKKPVVDKDIAASMGLTKDKFSRYKNGRIHPTVEFLTGVAKYFDITLDELVTGISEKNAYVYRYIPLHDKALTWLNETYQTDSELVRMLNVILSNKKVADTLLGALLIYVKEPMFKVQTLMNQDDPLVVDSESSLAITKAMILNFISDEMETMKDDWRNLYIENDKRLEEAMERLFLDIESRKRIRYKRQADKDSDNTDKRIAGIIHSKKEN